jgi:tetratricopeptide (TPR) repeat protein
MLQHSRRLASLGLLAVVFLTGRWVLAAQTNGGGSSATLQIADGLMAEQRYQEAFALYRGARQTDDTKIRVRAGAGAVRALLRVGMFAEAQHEGASIAAADPTNPEAQALSGDALWSSGLFLEAEDKYAVALALDPQDARALHGRGRSLASRQRPREALADILRATAAEPSDPIYQYSLGMVYEQLLRYEEAARTLATHADMLSKFDVEMAAAARTRATFLRSFGTRTPFELASGDQVYTVPFKIDQGRVMVKAKVNGTSIDMVVDTGSEHALLSPDVAHKAGVTAVAQLDTAGVGDFGFGIRGMQIGRIDKLEIGTMRVNNVSCLIASPSLKEMPTAETEAFSPLALGLSMAIDYSTRTLTMARRLPTRTYETTLPLRMARLPIVRGVINGVSPASFVLDTGSQATSLSRSISTQIETNPAVRRVPARVFGRGGWDRSAFLLPYIDLEFAKGVGFHQTSMIVLKLDAPSWLLGFQVGGIIGHEFLSQYSMAIDLERSQVGLQRLR